MKTLRHVSSKLKQTQVSSYANTDQTPQKHKSALGDSGGNCMKNDLMVGSNFSSTTLLCSLYGDKTQEKGHPKVSLSRMCGLLVFSNPSSGATRV